MLGNLDLREIIRAAYGQAWVKFNLLPDLTPDEKKYGSGQLRYDIEILVANGERDAEKIANAALCLIREKEQVARSKARVSALDFSSTPPGSELLHVSR